MPTNEIHKLDIEDFIGGLQRRTSLDSGDPTKVFEDIKNLVHNKWGELASRKFLKLLNRNKEFKSEIVGVGVFFPSNIAVDPQIIVITDNGRCYVGDIDGEEFVEEATGITFGTEKLVTMSQRENKMYIATGDGPVRIWNGTNFIGETGVTAPTVAIIAEVVDEIGVPVATENQVQPALNTDKDSGGFSAYLNDAHSDFSKLDRDNFYFMTSQVNGGKLLKYARDIDTFTDEGAYPVAITNDVDDYSMCTRNDKEEVIAFFRDTTNNDREGFARWNPDDGWSAVTQSDNFFSGGISGLPPEDGWLNHAVKFGTPSVKSYAKLICPSWSNNFFIIANTYTGSSYPASPFVTIDGRLYEVSGIPAQAAWLTVIEVNPSDFSAVWARSELIDPNDQNGFTSIMAVPDDDASKGIIYIMASRSQDGNKTRFFTYDTIERTLGELGASALNGYQSTNRDKLSYVSQSDEPKIRLLKNGLAINALSVYDIIQQTWGPADAEITDMTVLKPFSSLSPGGGDFGTYSNAVIGGLDRFSKFFFPLESDDAMVKYRYTYAYGNDTDEVESEIADHGAQSEITALGGQRIKLTFTTSAQVGVDYRVLYRTVNYFNLAGVPNYQALKSDPDNVDVTKRFRLNNNVATEYIDAPQSDDTLGPFSDDISTQPPPDDASMIAFVSGRMILAGFEDDPTKLAFSLDGQIQTFDAVGGVEYIGRNDGDPIKALVAMDQNRLLILKNNSIHIMRGDPDRADAFIQVNDKVGCIASRSAVMTDRYVAFLSKDGVYMFDGSYPTLISTPINNDFTELSPDAMKLASAAYLGNTYYLAVPNKDVSEERNTRIFRYNLELQAWDGYIDDEIKFFLAYKSDRNTMLVAPNYVEGMKGRVFLWDGLDASDALIDSIGKRTTGAVTDAFFVSASDEVGGREAWHAFDDIGIVGWWANTQAASISVDTNVNTDTSSELVNSYTISKVVGSENNAPKTWTFEGRDNPIDPWTVLDSQSLTSHTDLDTEFSIDEVEYRMYRLNITETFNAAGIRVSQMQIGYRPFNDILFRTKNIDAGISSMDKQWRRVFIVCTLPVGETATFSWSVDDDRANGVFATIVGVDGEENYLIQLPANAVGKDIQMSVSYDGSKNFSLNGVTLEYRVMRRRRGRPSNI